MPIEKDSRVTIGNVRDLVRDVGGEVHIRGAEKEFMKEFRERVGMLLFAVRPGPPRSRLAQLGDIPDETELNDTAERHYVCLCRWLCQKGELSLEVRQALQE